MLIDICDASELPRNARLCRKIGERHVLVLNTPNGLFACARRCTHENFELDDGEVVDATIECPLHGAVFNLRDGSVEFGPAEEPLEVFPVSVADGRIKIAISD